MSFQHRSEVDQLRAAVGSGGTAVLSQVLTGTGGVGKTQLAADYARTAWDSGEVDILVWISASSRAAITAGYAQAGVEILAADPRDPEQAARAFLAWLEPKTGQKPCRWLVVLDDVSDPADMRDWWPPTSPQGRVLVTTRRREAALTGAERRLVTVGLFTPQEAAAYFTAVLAAHDRHEPINQINDLASDLGYLPLALAQAAAYIIDDAITCADYRQRLADRFRKLADLLPEPSGLPDNQATTMAATWSLSIERADQLRPAGLARPMLQLTAMLDPNGIPSGFLASAPALNHLTLHRMPGEQPPAPVTAEEAAGALQALHRLNLIDHIPDAPYATVRVHQLIQRATRDALTADQHDQLAVTAADILTAAWPAIERDTALAQALRANAAALVRTAEDALYRPAPHAVLFRIGTSLGESGQTNAACDHYAYLATSIDHRLGPDHPDSLMARQAFARERGKAGDAAGAAAALAELLPDCVRVLGSDHPHTLATRHHLATWLGEAGDAAGAVVAFEELLPDRLRVLGRDHPDTLATRDALADFRGVAGDAAGAAAAYEELLPDRIRVMGPDHPDTFISRNNHAFWQGEAGDAAGAVVAFEELLADRLRVLGPDHPDTLATRHALADFRGVAGDAAGAAAAYEELLPDRIRVMGPDHPDTFLSRSNHAWWVGGAGDAAGAAAAYEELLTDQIRVMGPEHPSTLMTRNSLANWRGKAGDAAGAAAAFEELLADRLHVQGPDHPDTLLARHHLATFRGKAGDVAGALAAFEELLTDQVRVHGPDHPHIFITRAELARLQKKAGDAAGAVAAFEELLADQIRVQGADYRGTFITRVELARLQGEAGDAAGAVAAFEELLADQIRALGPDHPETLLTRNDLALWRGRAGGAAAGLATD
ncbi:tetratricopeptide repeat protein [Streptomyces sp. WAC08452]|uniref:Tetratricopeptide repeat protein n=1 Tax=Streptomyces vinaceusdrappus TaxID=67376 RepID=A0ABY6C4Q9_9ACTN|nr:tetratricopeptide repeat protein [Streptomyces vinaceusdrappus]RSS23548.1 tetratricopeptide repeat protein [Streptomyces sp. WAC08452]UXI82914.1 tetratricopeptide repeat protein [Streptomyces vinaceusdrappus]